MKRQQVHFNFENKKIGGFLYLPESSGKFPAVILVHGFGGGVNEVKNQFMCKSLADNNIIAFMFDFYDFPNNLSEISIADMSISLQLKILKKAVDYVESLENVDKTKIGLTGHSLGGLTITLYAPKDKRIKSLLIQSPAIHPDKTNLIKSINLEQWKKQKSWQFPDSWGGMKIKYHFVEDLLQYHPLQDAEKITIPTLLIHGDKDFVVPLQQSEELITHLKSTDRFVIIKNGSHTFKSEESLRQATDEVIKFFKRTL